MKKVVPLRQQITRAVQNNPHLDNSFLVSGCLCSHWNDLKECDKCLIRFYCYTHFRVKTAPVAELEQQCSSKA